MSDRKDDGRPRYDPEMAASYIGKYILIGVTILDASGKELRQEQLHGVVQAVAPDGFTISLRGQRAGQTWIMPPAHDAISPAGPGEYRLRSTGEIVKDPDLLSSWTITEPQKH